MSLRPHHKFEVGGRSYLIHIEKTAVFSIDERLSQSLDEMVRDPHIALEAEVEDRLKTLGLFEDPSPPSNRERLCMPASISAGPPEPPLSNLTLFVTQRCNLDCIYCYGRAAGLESGGTMDRTTAFRSVDWFLQRTQGTESLGIQFFGGEPLINFSLIEEVVAYALEKGKEAGKTIQFGVTTNATLLDDDVIAFLKQHRFRVSVSFDGPKEIQDKQRPYNNGRGSFDATLPKIKRLLEAVPGATFRATLMPGVDPAAVRRAMREIGFSGGSTVPASPTRCDTGPCRGISTRDVTGVLAVMAADAEELLEAIRGRNTGKLKGTMNSSFLADFLKLFLHNGRRMFPCAAGLGMVAISSSGDVYPCHRFVGDDVYRLGTVFSEGLNRDEFLKSPARVSPTCSVCFARYVCAGGCLHDNLTSTGSAFTPAEDECRLRRRATELAAGIACRLNEDDRVYLVKDKIIPPKPCPLDF